MIISRGKGSRKIFHFICLNLYQMRNARGWTSKENNWYDINLFHAVLEPERRNEETLSVNTNGDLMINHQKMKFHNSSGITMGKEYIIWMVKECWSQEPCFVQKRSQIYPSSQWDQWLRVTLLLNYSAERALLDHSTRGFMTSVFVEPRSCLPSCQSLKDLI